MNTVAILVGLQVLVYTDEWFMRLYVGATVIEVISVARIIVVGLFSGGSVDKVAAVTENNIVELMQLDQKTDGEFSIDASGRFELPDSDE